MALIFPIRRFPSILYRHLLLRRHSRLTLFLTILLSIAFLFFCLSYLVYKPPPLLIDQFRRRWPDVLWSVSTNEKIVALTVDDAPSPYTAQILSLLESNSAHATFFVIGSQVPGQETILQSIIRSGNELGNHAMRDEPSRSLSEGTLVEQIHSVEEMIASAHAAVHSAPPPPKYFRPGSGFFSDKMRAMLERLGYRLVLGSIYPHDPQIRLWRVNANHILSMLRPGAIIICHDRRSWTIPMLQYALPEIRKRGYKVVTVSQLLKETHA